MPERAHILINGLSMGSGGGYTVGREVFRHLADRRPHWHVTLAAITGHPLHENLRSEALPSNGALEWAPPEVLNRVRRTRYERQTLLPWARENGVGLILQLNGMRIPGSDIPTFSHYQDPWPYRPLAWEGLKDRFIALLKRRGLGRSLRTSELAGFTSRYLRDLICGYHRVDPAGAHVFLNGLSEDWLSRALQTPRPIADRPMEIVTLSNVAAYKRQSLVIRALPLLRRHPALRSVRYRIIGHCPPDYRQELQRLAGELGVADQVEITGRISDSEVQSALASARAYVLMSVCESFGLPAIEAMTHGTPVVVSNCCAMPEICGDAALYSPVDEVEPLADKLSEVLLDESLSARLQEAGRRRVALYRWETTAESMAVAIEQVLNKRSGSGSGSAA